jgi:hypothetical protein
MYGKAKSLGPETPHKAQIGEGARPRAPRGGATTGGCIFVHDYNVLSALLIKRIARIRRRQTVGNARPYGQKAMSDRLRSLPGDTPLGFEDCLSDVANALCCRPLEVGLASEARSTIRRRRSPKDDDEDSPPDVACGL